MTLTRGSGILLHPTSLPGRFGIGSLGPEAYRFVDFLAASGQKLWQVLPLGPTGWGDSPYQCLSAFAGNPLLISLERLRDQGLLSASELKGGGRFPVVRVDYPGAMAFKRSRFGLAFERFRNDASAEDIVAFARFREDASAWLDDFAVFMALKEHFHSKPWFHWPVELRFGKRGIVERYANKLENTVEYYRFVQYQFYRQWADLKSYANRNGIRIIGDIPLYVAHDSTDVWAHPHVFLLDGKRHPVKVAGVPPDAFSRTGQLWGNPVYNWRYLEQTGFAWWLERVKANLALYDTVRVDHFRGLAAFWAVPYGNRTALHGKWFKAPGRKLLQSLHESLGRLPLIAEDLGVITPDVEELRTMFDLPGMKILQYAFDGDHDNSYLPHLYKHGFVVYTGTHDNDTARGWFRAAPQHERDFAGRYLNSDADGVVRAMLEAGLASPADWAVTPMQDLLDLGSKARMNVPATGSGNWRWRCRRSDFSDSLATDLRQLTKKYGR